jgi:hypothetical protein
MFHGRRVLSIVGASLLIISAAVSANADDRLAVSRVGADQISFTPTRSEHGLVLTVSGPGEASFTKTFEPGEVASFRVVDDNGKALPDGVYSYELRPHLVVEPEIRREMAVARERGDDSLIAELQAEGKLPRFLTVQTGSFSIDSGSLVNRSEQEISTKDILHYDDVIITGSLCVGFDCQNGELFGFDTIILKEHNLRIYFNDTSYTASYPTNNWRMTINDSTNGGASYFSIDDVDDGTSIFKIEAGAPSNSLYVEDYGRVGLGTSTPVVELHIKDSDTPTNRLEQDSSGGWTAQTWDVAGNESNFFIRDATNGSKLPFRIQPSTPSSTLCLKSEGYVGIGTWSPAANLDIEASGPIMRFSNTGSAGDGWEIFVNGNTGRFNFRDTGTSNIPFKLDPGANSNLMQLGVNASNRVDINGNLVVSGTITPDYVFEPGFDLISIEEHAAYMWTNRHLPAVGAATVRPDGSHAVDVGVRSQSMLEELEMAHIYIEQLHKTMKIEHLRAKVRESQIEQLQMTVEKLQTRLEKLEGSSID